MRAVLSLVLDVGEELCVYERVFVLVFVHGDHEADGASSHDNEQDGHPEECLNTDQHRHLLVRGDIAHRVRVVKQIAILVDDWILCLS